MNNYASNDFLIEKYGELPVIKKLKNAIISRHYIIVNKLAQGAFGVVYSGYDLLNAHKPIVIKFTQNHSVNEQEFDTLMDIQSISKPGDFAMTYKKGFALIKDPSLTRQNLPPYPTQNQIQDNCVWSYLIQEKLGITLQQMLDQRQRSLSLKTTIQIGLQLLDRLRDVHSAGYTFLDLKPDNILIGDASGKEKHKIRLIDFGLCQKYKDNEGNHLPLQKINEFRGNFIFASVYAFHLVTQSRRDDLISLCYLLVYLLDGDVPFIFNQIINKYEAFEKTKCIKNTMTGSKLCVSPESKLLQPFVKEVFKMDYDMEPEYEKLKFLLVKSLMENEQVPTKQFDWTEQEEILIKIRQSNEQIPKSETDESELGLESLSEVMIGQYISKATHSLQDLKA